MHIFTLATFLVYNISLSTVVLCHGIDGIPWFINTTVQIKNLRVKPAPAGTVFLQVWCERLQVRYGLFDLQCDP
jgi:hypothetical protein